MKHYHVLLAIGAITLLTAAQPAQANVTYVVQYSGANERPAPNASLGSATATFTYETAANDFTYSITYAGLSSNAVATHIHVGGPNAAGPIILPIPGLMGGASGTLSGMLTNANLINQATTGITDLSQVNALGLAGNLYGNLHTTVFPGGEVRGQLVVPAAVPEPAALMVMAVGLAGLFGSRRVSRRR